ncbi:MULTISPECIES: type IX secretion system ring subunit PorN/GldN [Olivibacter]|uniref:Gliding motility protein GldN n=1 Tax=Olivibacter jilunii TaxID=985016 RepID=A0ABW6BAF8_9SPHI|nr:gliding motility protein GldN [Pseudosphingobacterium sp.]
MNKRNRMKTFLMTILGFFCLSGVLAQEPLDTTGYNSTSNWTALPDSVQGNNSALLVDTVPQTDGYYQVNDLHDAVPFAYPKVNPKNIRFYKRVWRDIDLKDKENYIFAIPGASLMEAIMKSIKEGKLTPYNPEDDGFKTKLTAREGEARFTDSVLVPIFDEEGNQIDAQMTLNEFNPEKVTKFRIKEDIFFDKQRGKLETRIIGVAPLMTINTSEELAESVGETPAFWLYFPQLRYTLVQIDVSDPDRELYDMTMDDLFVQRKFASKIVRQSSPSQQMQYATGEQSQDSAVTGDIEDKIKLYKARLWRNPKGVNPEDLLSTDQHSQKEKSPVKEEIQQPRQLNSGTEQQAGEKEGEEQ